MIRFTTAGEYVELSPFDITGVFVENLGPSADFTKDKPFKQYTVSIETSERVFDFDYKIFSNFFEEFETEFCEGIVYDINEFIKDYARVFKEHKPHGYVKLDIDKVVSRVLESTKMSQISEISHTSIIIDGMYELDPAEKYEYEDEMTEAECSEDEWYKSRKLYEYDDECECDNCWDRSSILWPWEHEDVGSCEERDQCMCPDCEAEFERQIAPYIKKVIKEMKSKKGV